MWHCKTWPLMLAGRKPLRAQSLGLLVLLCSGPSLLAQERHIATYGGVSGSLGPQWLGVDRRIFEKYGTKIEWVLMTSNKGSSMELINTSGIIVGSLQARRSLGRAYPWQEQAN